jgi:DNA-binding CsgD family transcriptional regulator
MLGEADQMVKVLDQHIQPARDADPAFAFRVEAELLALATVGGTRIEERRLEELHARAGDHPVGEQIALALGASPSLPLGAAAVRDRARRALAGWGLVGGLAPDSVAFHVCANVLVAVGGYADAYDALTAAIERARARGSLFGFSSAATARAHCELRRGNVRDALADARAAQDALATADALLPSATAVLLEVLLESGQVEDAQRVFETLTVPEVVPATFFYHYVPFSCGLVRQALGDHAHALEDFVAQIELAKRIGIDYPCIAPSRSGAALSALALGDRARALALAREELQMVRDYGAPHALGISLRTLGLVEAGNRGIAHLRESVAVLEHGDARIERARSRAELGSALRRTGQRSEARSLLREALDEADRCGAEALAGHVRDELIASGARPRRRRLTGVDALTASERRVARLAMEGMSNPQIAASLFVTRKTVENQLRSAYQKLGIASRGELARGLAVMSDPA